MTPEQTIEECYLALKEAFSKFGRKNKDKLKTDDFGYHLPELEDNDIVTDLRELRKIIYSVKSKLE